MNMPEKSDFEEEDNIPVATLTLRQEVQSWPQLLNQIDHEFFEWHSTQCKDS